jgi:filamentous hemagglutinin family protein
MISFRRTPTPNIQLYQPTTLNGALTVGDNTTLGTQMATINGNTSLNNSNGGKIEINDDHILLDYMINPVKYGRTQLELNPLELKFGFFDGTNNEAVHFNLSRGVCSIQNLSSAVLRSSILTSSIPGEERIEMKYMTQTNETYTAFLVDGDGITLGTNTQLNGNLTVGTTETPATTTLNVFF